MREIKFRAWDTDKKQMILPDYSDWEDFFIEPDGVVYRSFETGTYETYRSKREARNLIVMQFTGLKDKNGKEIYEGDIFVSNFGTKFLVEWYPRDCRFAIVQVSRAHVPKFQGEYFTMFTEMLIETEVIGNLYETPELLKQ